jgi:hypothetical protein
MVGYHRGLNAPWRPCVLVASRYPPRPEAPMVSITAWMTLELERTAFRIRSLSRKGSGRTSLKVRPADRMRWRPTSQGPAAAAFRIPRSGADFPWAAGPLPWKSILRSCPDRTATLPVSVQPIPGAAMDFHGPRPPAHRKSASLGPRLDIRAGRGYPQGMLAWEISSKKASRQDFFPAPFRLVRSSTTLCCWS